MNKQDVYQYLNEKRIPYSVVDHLPVYTVDEAEQLHLPCPEAAAKNLFLCDDKKSNYYLLTMRDGLEISLKSFQKQIGARRLRFASENDLWSLMQLQKGAVTPFGVWNDVQCIIQVFIDRYFIGKMIAVHPNENTATVYLCADDLVNLLREHGNTVKYIDLQSE